MNCSVLFINLSDRDYPSVVWLVWIRKNEAFKNRVLCSGDAHSLSFRSLAWNIPGHVLSGAIAYQILQRENPSTIPTVRSVLEKNTWYETRWKPQLDKLPESGRDEMLFMLAARWADDIRTRDKDQSRLPWHYVNYV